MREVVVILLSEGMWRYVSEVSNVNSKIVFETLNIRKIVEV